MSSIIDKTLAKTLISAFQAQNAAPGGPNLLTPGGQLLNGFFIDRTCLESMLSDSSTVAGVSVHIAKHPDYADSPENIFTIILSAAEPNPDFTGTNSEPPYLNYHPVWDQVSPCPPNCSGI